MYTNNVHKFGNNDRGKKKDFSERDLTKETNDFYIFFHSSPYYYTKLESMLLLNVTFDHRLYFEMYTYHCVVFAIILANIENNFSRKITSEDVYGSVLA